MAIISLKYKLIFVKTRKTASTSFEVDLAKMCSNTDIVTPVFPAVRGHVSRNWAPEGCGKFYNHMPAREIRDIMGDDFKKFYRVCFERHPVDKCLSHFSMMKNSPDHASSSDPQEWCDYLERGHFPVDTDRYTDEDGGLLVDRVYRYEEIDRAIDDLTRTVGLPRFALMTRAKSGFRHGVPELESVMADGAAKARIFEAFGSSLRFTPY